MTMLQRKSETRPRYRPTGTPPVLLGGLRVRAVCMFTPRPSMLRWFVGINRKA